MINLFVLQKNRLAQVPIEDRRELLNYQPIWVDVIDPSDDELAWIAEYYKVVLPDPEELGDLEASARYFEREEDGHVHIHADFLLDEEENTRSVRVAFVLTQNALFSIHDEDLAVFRLVRLRARLRPGTITDAKSVLLELFDANAEYSADSVEEIYERLEKASHEVLSSDLSDEAAASILETIAYEENLNGHIRRNVMDTRRAISFMVRSQLLTGEHMDDARQILRDIESIENHTAFLFEKINFLMDATVGFININQNKIIKLFSVVSVCLMPPTLIASVYGMNFKFMPELDLKYGYVMAIVLMVFSAIVPIIWFRRPTASGKTACALHLAKYFPIEIISMDSALVYRDMNIGTAKPLADELAICPHHLIDVIEPTDHFSAAQFASRALTLVTAIQSRGKIPVLVGGTMLYYRALVMPLDDLPSRDEAIRQTLDQLALQKGWAYLYDQLILLDPTTAARLNPQDRQRIQRALEVFYITGRPLSSFFNTQTATPSLVPTLISLEPSNRALLHERILQRFDVMLEKGFEEEVIRLRARGDLSLELPSMRCVGYRQMWQYLDHTIDYEQMREKGIVATRQLAKRQLTWLHKIRPLLFYDTDMTNHAANFEQQEIDKFSQVAHQWWDQSGEFKPLHDINPLRLNWIDRQVPLAGKVVLDVGCGGGILSESMAIKGAQVTGIDLSEASLETARLHARETQTAVTYELISVEALAARDPAHFDVVTCMEMLEHVPDPAAIVKAIRQLVKPGGMVFMSTFNRNLTAYVFAVLGAEYILKMLPKGTHDYQKFITPAELASMARHAGLALQKLEGMRYNPLFKSYELTPNTQVNYLATVLFDFDGTLADTAHDLANATNQALVHHGLAPIEIGFLKPQASSGAQGLLGAAGFTPEHQQYESLRQSFIEFYAKNLSEHTALFDGVSNILEKIETKGLLWGIVTNKSSRFTLPLVEQLGLDLASVVVCGDTTPYTKPSPEPLLFAAQQLDIAPESIIYVGDARRDIVAAKAANMYSVAAGYGYCAGENPALWGADDVINNPMGLNAIIKELLLPTH
ncbi:unnamed protein product, partial [Darwinula stevensoni]